MKQLLICIILLVSYTATQVRAQLFQVELSETGTAAWALDVPMDSVCGDSGHPIADGVTIYILQDRDGDGPCYRDSQATLCDNPPYCISGLPEGSVNFNEFVFNGSGEFSIPGFFVSTASPNDGYFTMASTSQYPNQFFLFFWVRVDVLWQIFVSELFIPPSGVSSHEFASWSCLTESGPCNSAPAAPTNVSATDCTSCSSVTICWSYADGVPIVPVDSFFIYRDTVPIGRVSRQDTSYLDQVVPEGRHSYYVTSRRAPRGDCALFSCAASPADSGSTHPHPISPDSVSATDDSCGYVRIAWNYAANSATDSFTVQRNSIPIAGIRASGEPGLRFFLYLTPIPERAGYRVIGWNSVCGEGTPSAIDSGGISLPITSAPSAIGASIIYCSWITVSWNSIPGARSYRIYRRTTEGVYAYIAEVAGTPLPCLYSDHGVTPYIPYEYKVQAVNACGSGPMPEGSAMGFRQDVPDTVFAVGATDGEFEDYIRITWQDAYRELGYYIYRDEVFFAETLPDVTVHYDWNAQTGRIYNYRVVGYNECGPGACAESDSGYRGSLNTARLQANLPDRFALHPNYPNPFNAVTRIEFDLPRASHVSLVVYDALGRQAVVLADGSLPAGKHTAQFDGQNLSSGIYFCQMHSERADLQIKMLLLK